MKPLCVDKCKCIQDYKVYNSDVVYVKDKQYICEYHPNGIYGAYYVVYLNDRVSCNINIKEFNNNFKRIKHESTSTRASKTSKRIKDRNKQNR
jgi:hypothetical protein